MPQVEANGCSFYYESDAFVDPWKTPEVVFIHHGAFRSSKFWYHWVPPLADRYRVIRRDFRGMGRSTVPGPDYKWTIEGLAEDVVAFMDALEIEKVHYMGESMGGIVGIVMAANYPNRLHSLTLCATPMNISSEKLQGQGMASRIKETVSGFVEDRWKQKVLTPLSQEMQEWVKSEWEKNDRSVIDGIMALAPTIDVGWAFSRITTPTLLISPTRSPLSPIEEQKELHKAIPGSKQVFVDGYGHELYWDQPAQCLQALNEFLDSLSASDAS